MSSSQHGINRILASQVTKPAPPPPHHKKQLIARRYWIEKKILNKLATFGDASPVCYYLGLFHVAKLWGMHHTIQLQIFLNPRDFTPTDFNLSLPLAGIQFKLSAQEINWLKFCLNWADKGSASCIREQEEIGRQKLRPRVEFPYTYVSQKLTIPYASWSVADPWHFGTDPYRWLMDPDPAIFITDLQDANKLYFLLLTFRRYIYIIFRR